MDKHLLLIYIIFIGILSHENLSYGKLVFVPGSDVGYILPDDLESSHDNDNMDLTNFVDAEEVSPDRKSKRAFMNTIFDDFAGVNEWERLQSQSHSVKKEQRIDDLPVDSNDELPEYLKDNKHGIAMGISAKECDDGKTMLQVDWNGSPTSFTCYTPKTRLDIRYDLASIETCDHVPANYTPRHYCMNEPIQYNSTLPTYGPHRPLWLVFGEYRYVPPQRWLHSIEHGSIVFLYHPCTQPILVINVQKILRSCIYKHVTSASNDVSLKRPMVLIAWGCKMEFSYIEESDVIQFIKKRALHGPEGHLSKQGQYTEELLNRSAPPEGSNINDENLCPNM